LSISFWNASIKVTKEMKFVKFTMEGWLERQGYSKKIVLNEKDLKSKGNIVQIVKNKAHTEIKPHFHKHMIEIYYIVKGNAVVFCGDSRIRTKPGDTLLCEPKEVHGLVNDTDEDFQFVVFKIDAKDEDMYWV